MLTSEQKDRIIEQYAQEKMQLEFQLKSLRIILADIQEAQTEEATATEA